MERDMELIRRILFEVEKMDTVDIPRKLPFDVVPQEKLFYHLWLLREADLIVTEESLAGLNQIQFVFCLLFYSRQNRTIQICYQSFDCLRQYGLSNNR